MPDLEHRVFGLFALDRDVAAVVAFFERAQERREIGDAAPERLEDLELRIERHLATLLSSASRAPIPSIRLIQAPVFHGHS
ncbi:MAG: hypothetical protein SGJ19_26625, partial [Planctomycetia bacterium]|nr:hypothetical protein [Planctomycetia bacterium]